MEIKLKGETYFLLAPSLAEEGPLAYPNQVDSEGELLLDSAFDLSYAHYFPEGEGKIMRFREQIGTRADIEVVSNKT